MIQALTRRGLIAAAPAFAAVARSPASLIDGRPDAPLSALRPVWRMQLAEYYAALDTQAFLERRPGVSDREHRAAHRLVDAALDATMDLVDRIASFKARTAGEIAFKVEISKEFAGDLEDLNRSIVADLVVMGGANA